MAERAPLLVRLPARCLALSPQERRPVAPLTAVARALAQSARALGPLDGRLELLGPGLLVRSDEDLRVLAASPSPSSSPSSWPSPPHHLGACLSQLHLLDGFMYRGSLSWKLLSGLTALRLLAVAPSSQESFDGVSSSYRNNEFGPRS